MPYGASLSFETAAHPGLPPDTPLQAKIILNHVPLSLSVSASLCQGAGKGIATSFPYTMLIALNRLPLALREKFGPAVIPVGAAVITFGRN